MVKTGVGGWSTCCTQSRLTRRRRAVGKGGGMGRGGTVGEGWTALRCAHRRVSKGGEGGR